jgi:predicted HAD superfamily Cof-like phosphohydrolase
MVDERELVREFHTAFDVPVGDGPPDLTLPDDRLRMRYRLVAEEFAELTGAILGPVARAVVERAVEDVAGSPTDGADLVATADATVDLRYVLHGLELECGIPGDAVFAEVHASNLAKLGPDGTALRRADGKILKPAGWRPPDVAGVLARAGARDVGSAV